MDEKDQLAGAFQELERQAVHPGAEEIAAALDGVGSAFARAEIQAHVGWCEQCRQVADEYQEFGSPALEAETNAAWEAMRRKLPAPAVKRPQAAWGWLAVAAALTMVAGPALTWQMMKNRPPEIVTRTVERVVERPAPVQVANAAVVDLFPVGDGTRSGGAEPMTAAIPAAARLVTFILNGAAVDQTAARVLDAAGKEVWSGRLQRQSGVYTLALGAETLRLRPLTIECGAARYKIP